MTESPNELSAIIDLLESSPPMLDAWLGLIADWLREATPVGADPRFWTVPPEQHVGQLLLHASFALLWMSVSAPGLNPSGLLVGRPTRSELAVGLLMAGFVAINAVKKLLMSPGPFGDLIECALPCHGYTMMACYSMLGTSRRARETAANLLLYCAWMPLLALAFPDLDAIYHVRSPLREISLALFFAHHVALALMPAFIAHFARLGRFRVPPLAYGSFAQYVAFANSYIGVFLASLALAAGRNLNYSLWPPPLPPGVEASLGGVYFHVTMGLLLSFVLGPLMRVVYYPAARAAVRRLVLIFKY